MKMERQADGPKLYPDLSEFYPHSRPDSTSAANRPPQRPPQRLLPTAPPLHQVPEDLHPLESVPEEPEKDYMLDDFSVVDNTPGSTARTARSPREEARDLTIDYTLEDISLEDLLELEPDYDTDDLHQDTLNNLNNLNLTATEKKILHDKNIEVPPPPRNDKDFRAWMTWRLQANKLLAAVILARKGQQVHVRESEIRRKPLTRQNVEKVVQQARGAEQRRGRRNSAERTSLPACPYVMYGIPRVNLPPAHHP